MSETPLPALARRAPESAWLRLRRGRALPLLILVAVLIVIWYLGAIWLNAQRVIDLYEADDDLKNTWTTGDLVRDTLSMNRPVLPAPHQVLMELDRSVLEVPPDSNRSLLYHAWVTLSAALVGFAMGALLGIVLAIGIVHVATLERALMPWVIASQTIPILAIAPMIIVVLGSIGFVGLMPKAFISAYLCFFPVTIGMVKGLTSPEPIQLDLIRTYSASRGQVFRKLRWPASFPFLFPSLKIAVALAVVGAIVGELPTGAAAGLGARLLAGSYYGQTIQIWSALVLASLVAGLSVAAVGWTERLTLRHMGGRV
ncbi:MAG TPA: ABC transporter permease [Stellaceae bacterium]|nr:ABC transporter permease [Stellaceae bacterium]